MAKNSPMMVMQDSDVKRRLRLLRQWDWLCVVCGEPFESLESVTVEHLVPKSMLIEKNVQNNHAPSHYNCNRLRGTMSLIEAAYLLERRRRVLGKSFHQWLNKAIPNRLVPDRFLAVRTTRPDPVLPGFEFVNGDAQ